MAPVEPTAGNNRLAMAAPVWIDAIETTTSATGKSVDDVRGLRSGIRKSSPLKPPFGKGKTNSQSERLNRAVSRSP